MDEVVSRHERLDRPLSEFFRFVQLSRIGTGYCRRHLRGSLGLTYLRFLINLPRRSRILLFNCGITVSQRGLAGELIAPHYAQRYGLESLPFGLIATAKEALQMVGTIALIYALFDCMKSLSGTEIGIFLMYRPEQGGSLSPDNTPWLT